MTRRRASLVVTGSLLAWSRCAFALNPSLDVSQYAHTSWKIRDGLVKSPVNAIAQTPDGYLWLGTDRGLFRFDGVKNVAWEPPRNEHLPSGNIMYLYAGRDGTLWIGTINGLASWQHQTLTHYQQLDGFRIGSMVEDRAGTLWLTRASLATGRWSLSAFHQGRFEVYGVAGSPGADAVSLHEDSHGALWIQTTVGSVWRWQPGPPRLYSLTGPASAGLGLLEDRDGALVTAIRDGIARFVDGREELVYRFPRPVAAISRGSIRDRDGGLWIGTTTSGLVHVHGGNVDTFAQLQGLSGNSVSSVFEDREGNVWVGTSSGLDRFRDATGASLSIEQGLSGSPGLSVLASKDGSVWISSPASLRRVHDSEVTTYHEEAARMTTAAVAGTSRRVREIAGAMWAHQLSSIFQDRLGRIWVGTNAGVGYLENDRFVQLKGVPGKVTRAIVEDRSSLWVVKDRDGLFRVRPDQRDVERIPWAALNRREGDGATAAVADPKRDGVWVGFLQSGVAYFADGQVRAAYTASDGLGRGRVRQLWLDSGATLWAATDGGLSRVKPGRIATLTSKNGLPCDSVQWSIQDDAGAIWMAMGCGVVVRISRDEMAGWLVAIDQSPEAQRTVRTTVFDETDGVRTFAEANYYNAAVTKTLDGRLWFASADGVGVIDPGRIPVNVIPPPVHIQKITADRHSYDPDASAAPRAGLPALTRDFQVDYTALSLVAPDKVLFRYKLEGFDRDWQEAGNRRQAFYTNLPPRNYRFRVIAANNSGVWNETGASIDFSIASAYYQTTWFLALSIIGVVGLVWTAHRIRVRIVEKHEGEISALNERLMKAQEQERIRIAGDLHDGVMQEMLAATMMLGAAKRRIPDESDAKAKIDQVQEKLIKVGTEIRQLSHDLHPPMLQEAGLPNAARAYCEQFSAASGTPVTCECDESARDLSRGAALALFRVLQEALGNAAKYATATHITVHLARTNGSVSLMVSDDGVGFDPGRLTAGGLGLIMMRERASQLDGTFEFDSAPGRGTTIRVVIPFR